MFFLSTKIADRITDILAGSGQQGRAAKAVRTYRRDPTEPNREAAEASLALLDQNKQFELRAVARA